MRKIINISLCVIVIIAVSSCDFLNDKKTSATAQDSVTTVEGISQEIKNKIAAQDTLMNALVLKVDTLAKALTQTQKENVDLKAQVDRLESPKSAWGYMTLAALAIAIVAFILSVLRKGISREKVDEIFSYNLDKSKRIAELKVDVSQLKSGQNSKASQSLTTSLHDLDARLQTVESYLARLSSNSYETHSTPNPSVAYRQEQGSQSKEAEYKKIGYAKNDKDEYFTTIYDSNQEGCVFKITFTSQSKGKFNIIALDKIQSRNDWQKKVECSGISIKDASDFRLEEEGICEKIDEKTWKVTKPLKILLLK